MDPHRIQQALQGRASTLVTQFWMRKYGPLPQEQTPPYNTTSRANTRAKTTKLRNNLRTGARAEKLWRNHSTYIIPNALNRNNVSDVPFNMQPSQWWLGTKPTQKTLNNVEAQLKRYANMLEYKKSEVGFLKRNAHRMRFHNRGSNQALVFRMNGKLYKGAADRDGHPKGFGQLIDPVNGRVQYGFFKPNGKLHGSGLQYYNNNSGGNSFNGKFVNGKPHNGTGLTKNGILYRMKNGTRQRYDITN